MPREEKNQGCSPFFHIYSLKYNHTQLKDGSPENQKIKNNLIDFSMSKHFKVNHENRKDMEALLSKLCKNCPVLTKEIIKNISYLKIEGGQVTIAIHKEDDDEDLINEFLLGDQQTIDEEKDIETLKKAIALENKVEKIEYGLLDLDTQVTANKQFIEANVKGGILETMMAMITQIELYPSKLQWDCVPNIDLSNPLIFDYYFEHHINPIYFEYQKVNNAKKLHIINSNQEFKGLYRAYLVLIAITSFENISHFYNTLDHKLFIDLYCKFIISKSDM